MPEGNVFGQHVAHPQMGLGHKTFVRQELDIAIQMPRRAEPIKERRFRCGEVHELYGDAIRHVSPDAVDVPGCAPEQGKSRRGRMVGIVYGQDPTRCAQAQMRLKLNRKKLGVTQHGRVFKAGIGIVAR